MKHKDLSFVLSLIFLIGCNDSNTGFVRFERQPSDIIIFGKPKTVTLFNYKAVWENDGSISKGEFNNITGYAFAIPSKFSFDRKGRNTEIRYYKSGDTLSRALWRISYPQKNIIRTNGYRWDDLNILDSYTLEEMNDDGEIISIKEFGYDYNLDRIESEPFSEDIYIYDAEGTKIKKKRYQYHNNTQMVDSTIVNYDIEYKDGKLYKGDGLLFYFNDQGIKIKVEDTRSGAYNDFYLNGLIKKPIIMKAIIPFTMRKDI